MKKLVFVFLVVLGVSMVSCETPDSNDETAQELEGFELYKVDKDDIVRPGDDPNN